MYITTYISQEIKPGKVNYSPDRLLKMVKEMKLSHLPMFSGLDFIGNIAEEDLAELAFSENVAEDINDFTESFFISEDQTLFDAFQLMHINHTNILPVLSKELKYLGCVTEQNLVEALAKLPFIQELAVSMIVSIATKDLSISAISNIIEANNGKIFGLIVIEEQEDSTKVLVRFSSSNLLSIGETFERFGYQVIQKFYNDEKTELLQSRYAQLLKYMNT